MIALDLKTFDQSAGGGNVTGVIFLKLDSGPFPGEGWSDFPIIILGWWTTAMLELRVPKRRNTNWQFMDGPYIVSLSKETPDSLEDQTHPLWKVENALIEAGERALTHCEANKMLNRDLDTLRDNIRQLKAYPSAKEPPVFLTLQGRRT